MIAIIANTTIVIASIANMVNYDRHHIQHGQL